MTREQMIAIVEAHAAGSQEPAQHTHIECNCDDLAHRRDDYDQGCFCPDCAAEAAVKLGYPPTDVEPEAEGPDDSPQWCENCGHPLTTEITVAGALDELAHWESSDNAILVQPYLWRELMLCVVAIADEHLPRVRAIIERHRVETP
jgi:hypothetical protein